MQNTIRLTCQEWVSDQKKSSMLSQTEGWAEVDQRYHRLRKHATSGYKMKNGVPVLGLARVPLTEKWKIECKYAGWRPNLASQSVTPEQMGVFVGGGVK